MAKPKKRVTRKELLKEPDEFITFTGKMIAFSRQYYIQIMYGAVAFLIIIFSIAGYRYYTGWKEKKAFTSLEQVMTAYNQALNGKSDLTDVKNQFREVVDKYDGYAGGKMARIVFADICYQTNDLDTAISLYNEALADFEEDALLQNFIKNSLGYAYEAKQDYKNAMSYFNEIAEAKTGVMKDVALFNLARLYTADGDKEKGIEAYKKILSDHADSLYIEIVREKLSG